MIRHDYAKRLENNLLNQARNACLNEHQVISEIEAKLFEKKIKQCATRVKKKWFKWRAQ